MRVLITGINGFTGYYVKQALEPHVKEIMGLKSDVTDLDALTHEIKLIQPDAVIHLAAIAFATHNNVNDFYTVNLIGTHNLLNAIYQHVPKIKTILLASSASVYGHSSVDIISEDTVPKPNSDYAISKLAMEQMALLWMNRLPLFIVRPFNYTGVKQTESCLIPKIVSHFQRKAPLIELGNLDVWREFNDVRAVSKIYVNLLLTRPIGEIVNICTGNGYSVREILNLCEQISNYNLEVKVNPQFMRENEAKLLIGNPAKLRRLIGDFEQKKLSETLQWMLDSAPK